MSALATQPLGCSVGPARPARFGLAAPAQQLPRLPSITRSCGQGAGSQNWSRRPERLPLARALAEDDEHCHEDGDCLSEEDGSVIVRDDLDALLQVLPQDIRDPLVHHPQRASLLEVVLDLGRRPEARFLGQAGGQFLRDAEITKDDLAHAEAALGDFGGDNRAGVEGTLHRISAIRNRKGDVVGLTCRVGRAVTGHIDMIRDLLDGEPHSVLFLGRPGVGKTTVIREMARVLSDVMHKRVVIVDTSNEIGGDGDVPHPAIGGARRMQVPDPSQQHKIMIEAVENHMPEVVIVDEIGTEAEALACRTIAERGVQLIGTAHGQLLENLIKNPTLSDLVGGICSVTLGDDEARSRGTQKSVLERKAPPTFPYVLEMRERAYWVTHWVEESVDALLNGKVPTVQVRRRNPDSKKVVVQAVRYDTTEERDSSPAPAAPYLNGSQVAEGLNGTSVFDGLFVSADAARPPKFGTPASGGPASAPAGAAYGAAPSRTSAQAQAYDAFDWALKLKDYSESDALAMLSEQGYTDGFRRSGDKFSFANGTGAPKNGKGKRRQSVGRALPRRRR